MRFSKGDKVFYVEVRHGEITKKEWTSIKSYYVNSADYWECAKEITLENGKEIIQGDNKRETEHLIGNSFLRGTYNFIIDDEKNAVSEICKYLDEEEKYWKKEIDECKTVIDNLEKVKEQLKEI
jgi:hypothetical protein